MELSRPAAASTFVSFPMADSTGFALSGLGTLTGTWIAWADTAGPNAQGNPGFKNLSGGFTEIAATAVYAGALATTELPAASPYVMLRFTGGSAATQYLLIKTSSQYANITAINGTAITAPVTAGYMPIDVKQTISLTAPADNSIEKSLARSFMAATNYIDAAVSQGVLATSLNLTSAADNTLGKALSRMYMAATNYIDAAVSQGVLATTLSLTAPTDNTLGKALSRMYMMATNYVDAAVSSRSAPATAQTIDQTTAISAGTDNSIGKCLGRLYQATTYLNASITSRLALTDTVTLGSPTDNTVDKALARMYMATPYVAAGTAQTIDQTTVISGGTDNSLGKLFSRLYHATQYLDAAVSTRSTLAGSQTIDQTTAISAGTDNSIGKCLGRLYQATTYLDAAVSTRLAPSTVVTLVSPTDNTVDKALARLYMFATNYGDAAISSRSTLAGAQTIDQTTAISAGTDNSIGKCLGRLYQATTYLNAAVTSRVALTDTLTLGASQTDNTVDKALSRLYMATPFTALTIGTVNTVGTGAISAASFSANAIDAASVDVTTGSEFADAFLGRSVRGGASTGRRVYEAIAFLRNRANLAAGTLTVYQTDDLTTEWTAAVATEGVTAILTDIDPT